MDEVVFFFGGWEPVARVVVVGTPAYLVLVLLLRVAGKRTLVQMNAFDLIVTVALGATFARALTAHGVALLEAITAFGLLVSLQYGMARLQRRWPRFAHAVTAPPTLLLFQGRILHDALRRERLTEAELRTAVREQGAASLEEVEAVVLESHGRFAVVPRSATGDRSALEELLED